MAVHSGGSAGDSLDITVEVSDGHTTAKDIGALLKTSDKKAASAIRTRVRKGVSDAGADIVNAVKAQASWSTRIPATVRLKTSFGARSAGVTVTAGGKAAPEAAPLEYGSQGNGGTLRHPVFARKDQPKEAWTWVNQPTRPFFYAAVKARTPAVDRRMQQVMDDVAKDIGFTD